MKSQRMWMVSLQNSSNLDRRKRFLAMEWDFRIRMMKIWERRGLWRGLEERGGREDLEAILIAVGDQNRVKR